MHATAPTKADVSIRLLGDCNVSSAGNIVYPTFHFLRILAYLIIEGRGQPISRRRIANLIWSDNASEQVNADIRQAVARIRRFQQQHGFELLMSDANMFWLNSVDPVYTDLVEFRALIEHPSPKAWVRLCEIYGGDLLGAHRPAGQGFEEWLDHHRTALRFEFINAISQAVLPTSLLTHQAIRIAMSSGRVTLRCSINPQRSICTALPVCAGASLTSLAYSEAGHRTDVGWQVLLLGLGSLLALTLPLLLLWRHRAPYTVTLVASAVALVFPLGTWTALVALGSLVGRRRGTYVWWTAAAAAVATAVTVVRDTRGSTSSTSLVKLLFAPADAAQGAEVELGWWVAPLFVVLGMVIAVGSGLVVRARREAAVSAQQVSAAQHASDQLGDRLARQLERERIGREVHDVLGHRLSLLNLHAGALESHAPPDGPLGESARLVRESAARAMEDLRSLLDMLNDPLEAGPAEPDLSLVDLPEMIAETVDTGAPVSSSVYVDGAEHADPALARAVYRIVQELLTNARRHAPGRPIRLEVHGGPSRGMYIDARNPYGPPAAPGQGGQGLRGIAERVELLGGTLRYGLDEGGRTFRVTVELPWRGGPG